MLLLEGAPLPQRISFLENRLSGLCAFRLERFFVGNTHRHSSMCRLFRKHPSVLVVMTGSGREILIVGYCI